MKNKTGGYQYKGVGYGKKGQTAPHDHSTNYNLMFKK